MSEPIKVGIDVSAVPARPAGAGWYTVELVRALNHRDDIALTLITRKGDGPRWTALASEADVQSVAPNRRPLRLVWEQTRLPRVLKRSGLNVFHSPHYTMPEAAKLPRVVTVHDLTFFSHPEWHEKKKVPLFRRATRVAARHADAVVCVSQSTADELQAHCPVEVPVTVIPHGLDHQRFLPRTTQTEIPDALARTRVGVEDPYIAFVGTLEPRKDVPTLVAAFDRIAAMHKDLHLVLAGGNGWGAAAVSEAVDASPHATRVHRLGYVDDDVIPALLRGAQAVAYPSLEEGFGLPALEALACGAPLVTTRGSAMEEVASGAALLVEPGDVDGLAGALDTVIRGDIGLSARRDQGLAIAARHTWAACAASHIDAYRHATESHAASSLRSEA